MLKYLIFILAAGYAGAQIIPPSSGGGGGGTYTLTAAKIAAAGGVTNGGYANGVNFTNVDAKTVGGISAEDLMRVGYQYYFTTNIVTYGVVTGRTTSLSSPTNTQMSTYTAPTNGQYLGTYLIPSNEMPTVLLKGVYTFKFWGYHEGNNRHPMVGADIYIVHASNGVVFKEFENVVGTEVPYSSISTPSEFLIQINITEDIPREGYAFLFKTKMISNDGYSGTFYSYFGLGYWSGFTMPIASGLYVTHSEYQAALTNGQTSVYLNTVPPPNGFENQTNQTVSFNPSTRQATVAPVGSSFRVTSGGITYTYNGSVTSSVGPNAAGGLYAYFRPSDGAFVCTNVAWNISDGEAQAIFAYLDTNAPASTALTIDERHGVAISDSDHLMRHLTVGSTWASGMTISHFGADTATAAGSTGTNTCIAITDAGVFYDEDVRHTTVTNGTSGGSTNTAGVFPILYKNSAGYWRKRAGTQFPFAYSGNVPTYYTAAGVETSVSEDQFFVYWLVAYGSADGTNMFLISHPSTYADTASAQSGATFASFSSVVGGLASVEMLVAYRLIFQFNAAAAGSSPVSVKSSKLRMVDDFRNVPGGVIMAGVGAGSGSYVLTSDKISAAGGVTNYAPTPFDAAVTITNSSAVTVTSYFGHAYSRTFTSTGTITHMFISTNATAGNEIFMETTATGLPARVWPSGYVFGYAGAISSNAPSPSPWSQMSVQKTPMGAIVWAVTGAVWQAGTP